MCYINLLFLYKNQLSSLLFNEITVFNFSNNLDYKKYLIEILTLFIKDEQQFDTIKIINISDTLQTDSIKYYIDINEETEKIIYNNENLDFNLIYNEFLQKYNLWNGKDYQKDDFQLTKKNKKQLKEYVKKRHETIKNNIKLLYKLKKKREIYELKIATQLVVQYKYNITNYKKINFNKLVSPIIVTKLDNTESRVDEIYSKQKYSITIMSNNNTSTIYYEIIMVDDGNDYYASHTHRPTVYYDINENSMFSKIYLSNLLKYLMSNYYGRDVYE